MNDKEIFELSGITDMYPKRGKWIADKQYWQGIGIRVISPYKRRQNRLFTMEQWAVNHQIGISRVIIENAIGRLKRFGCMKQIWRHQLQYHEIVLKVCLNLANLDIRQRPLRRYHRELHVE